MRNVDNIAVIGQPSPSTKEDIVRQVLDFVLYHLPAWRDDPIRVEESSEPTLTAQLVSYLNNAARYENLSVTFQTEFPQIGHSKIDISVNPTYNIFISGYTIYTPIIVIETKRLPTPGKKREREYVISDNGCGGIQRFKENKYSPDAQTAAIIGYIQKHDAQYFYDAINSWINDLASLRDQEKWKSDEQLISLQQLGNGVSKAISVHPRNSSSPIVLWHLWINMTNKNN